VAAAGALPLYTSVTVGGGAATVRSIDDAGIENTLGNRRFLRFSLSQARDITITATSSKTVGDADFWLFHNGVLYDASLSGVEPEVADFTNAPAGDYLLEVYEYENILGDEPGDYDITVTVQ
jgi:hypothetical protein